MRSLFLSAATAICLLSITESQAALIDRGGGLIYDTDLNITWLQDANYAKTSGYTDILYPYPSGSSGSMAWSQASTWVANLVYHDSVRNVDYDDWRLPSTTDIGAPGCDYAYSGTDCGDNVDPVSSEMAHLFFVELGNKSFYDTFGNRQSGSGLVNTGPFINFQYSIYLSGTDYAPDTTREWLFDFGYGEQYYFQKTDTLYALAVRPGDVAAVPEPEMWGLMLSGLTLVGITARRRKAR